MQKLKPVFYDDFACIADKCSYTCCRDWNISVDDLTYSVYNKMEPIKKNCYFNKDNGQTCLKLKKNNTCSFLDERGLCVLIKQYGENILSDTCRSFPRHIVEIKDVTEYALSNACPAVLQILKNIECPLTFVLEDEKTETSVFSDKYLETVEIRNLMIDLMQISNIPLWMRLYLIYDLSRKIDKDKDSYDRVIQNFNSDEYLIQISSSLEKLECNYAYKLQLSFELFQYINGLFKNHLGYQRYIEPLSVVAKEYPMDKMVTRWSQFEEDWNNQKEFIENICVNYIFQNILPKWNRASIYINTIALLLEYEMIKFTLFLQWLNNDYRIVDTELIEISCYYARIIEHNNDKMIDFIKNFETEGMDNPGKIFILIA